MVNKIKKPEIRICFFIYMLKIPFYLVLQLYLKFMLSTITIIEIHIVVIFKTGDLVVKAWSLTHKAEKVKMISLH